MQLKSIHLLISTIVLCVGATVTAPTFAQAIKKCQDADGNWHYGNVADIACADAVVDELNESGTKVGEDLPPPSEEELQRKEEMNAAIEEQKQFSSKQREQDLEVVRIYGSEETIVSTRDRKIAAIDNNVDVTRQIKAGTMKDIGKLRDMKQTSKVKKLLAERETAVESYDRVIKHNLSERDKLASKYDKILVDFREAYQRIYGQ